MSTIQKTKLTILLDLFAIRRYKMFSATSEFMLTMLPCFQEVCIGLGSVETLALTLRPPLFTIRKYVVISDRSTGSC